MLTFTELQGDVDALSEQEQDKLAAYLTMLRKSRELGYDEQLADSVGEDADSSWVNYNQLKN